MTTRMLHPQHGATHAYGAGDVERHKGMGWYIESEGPPEKAADDHMALIKTTLATQFPVINGGTSREPEDVIEQPSVAGRDALIPVVSLHEGRDEMAPVKRKYTRKGK